MRPSPLSSLVGLASVATLAACSAFSSGSGSDAGSDSAEHDHDGGATGDAAGKRDGGPHSEAGSSGQSSSHGQSGHDASTGPDGTTGHDASTGHDGSAGHDTGTGHDSSAPRMDGGSPGADGGHAEVGGGEDGSHPDGGAPPMDATSQGSCTAGAVRCAPGDIVESCNSTGTAWLFYETCTSGCTAGLCTGACTPGATRCAGTGVETCNTGGTAYGSPEPCSTFCSSTTNACAVSPVTITTNTTMDGVVVVDGDFTVETGVTLSSKTGNLTIYASSITVQQGASIVVAATGTGPLGAGNLASYAGSGGSYGTTGGPGDGASTAPAFGSSVDSAVAQGGPGGGSTYSGLASGGAGAGVLQLYANVIDIAGQVTANGGAGASGGPCNYGSGGGAGGGILLAAPSVTVSGAISAAGGAGGMILSECPGYGGNAGGEGRIKILSSTASPSVTGSLTGVVSEGLLPPIPVTSTSHPNPSITYNDDFPSFDFSWSQPFTGTQGYYVLGATAAMVPTPANAQFVSTDYVSLPSTTIMSPPPSYTLLFQITPVTASSTVGTIETTFPVQINTVPPTLTSSSHPTQTAWSANVNPYFSWTYPVPAASVVATYYVFDHMGDTVPTTADTKLPASQTSLLLSNVADGIWVMHILAQDPAGYLTHAASSYRVNIGPNPGTGSLSGAVVNAMSQPAPNVTVSLNGGLYTTTTNSMGVYNFMNVPAVTWQVSATSGTMTATGTGTVTSGGSTTTNLML